MIHQSGRAASILVLTVLCIAAVTAFGGTAPERESLWPGPAPVDENTSEEAKAYISVFHPEKPNGTAVVICPGGGYRMLVKGGEGTGIAKWLNKHGVTGVVLEYLELESGGHGLNGYKGPMWDAWQAQSLEWLKERKLIQVDG